MLTVKPLSWSECYKKLTSIRVGATVCIHYMYKPITINKIAPVCHGNDTRPSVLKILVNLILKMIAGCNNQVNDQAKLHVCT